MAASFAIEQSRNVRGKKVDAALYGVPCPPVVGSAQLKLPKLPAEPDVQGYYPPHLSQRITVQRGMFTHHKAPDQGWEPPGLKKRVIPSECGIHIKLALSRAGINRASPFPGIDGIAKHTKWLHKWELV